MNCSVGYAQQSKKNSKKKAEIKTQVIDTPKVSAVADSLPSWWNDSLYLDPVDTMHSVSISSNALETDVIYNADDSMPYDAVTRTVYLYHNAKVNYGTMELTADFIKIDLSTNTMTAKGTTDSLGEIKGRPVFKEGATEYKAEVIKYNFKTKKGYISELRSKEGDGYVHGQNVKRNPDSNLGINNAKYTTCDQEHPHYYIGATKIKVIPNKKIITGPANLWIEDVPTPLAVPFGIFPLKRGQSSGLIFPQYGNSPTQGYFLRNGGWYFALGDHHDLQLTGDIYSNTSWAARGNYRYITRYRFSGNLGLSYNLTKVGFSEDPDYSEYRGFNLIWMHRADPKARPNTYFTSNVNIISNSNYNAINSYNIQNIVTSQLSSSISFAKSFNQGKYNLSSNARMDQNTYTREVTMSFPDLTFTVSSFAPFKSRNKPTADKWYENITTNYTFQFRNDLRTKDTIFFRDWSSEVKPDIQKFLDTATNFGMTHSLPIQTSFKLLKYYTLSVGANLNDYMYFKTITKDTLNGLPYNQNQYGFSNALTYSARMGLNTRYYGIAQFNKRYIRAIRHVVIPTIDFTYAPDFSQASYGYFKSYRNSAGNDIRYSIYEKGIFGGPTAGRQGNIGFSVDNNLELKIAPDKHDSSETERKVQIFESLLLRGYYNTFADSLNLSQISISARTRLFKNIAVTGNANMDPYYNEIYSLNGYKYVRQRNIYYWNKEQIPGIITYASLGLSAGFSPSTFAKKGKKRALDEGELRYFNENPADYLDFSIPWNLNISYTVQYNKYNTLNNPTGNNFIQTFYANGDVSLTKNWKINYNMGYDFINNKISMMEIDFVRDLHCWEFRLNWIPVGFRQYFLFTINVKSSLLQDLKMTRRKDWYDRTL